MMTDLSVHCPGLDDVFQKVRHLLLKEADRLEEKHKDEDKVARVAVMLYKVQCEQEKEESRRRLARTRFAPLFVPPVRRMFGKSHHLY
jgi:TPP-dependent indolepyruvate ferredoxin oxidoreductase alpha subunit